MSSKLICKYCSNKALDEELIQCASCNGYCHPSCLELPSNIVPAVKTYDWQCNDCKFCYECKDIENEEQILFCDTCDRGYHMYCAKPKLKKKPKGDWYCPVCVEKKKKSELKKNTSTEKKVVKTDRADGTEMPTASTSTASSSKVCLLAKKFSKSKVCPFPGCDGTGNVSPGGAVHFSVSRCPMSKNERKRERELLSMKETEEPPSKLPGTSPIKSKTNDLSPINVSANTNSVSNQTPIEHIVSRTDMEMFEAAQKKARQVMELEKEMAPSADGIKSIYFGNVEIEAWYKSQYPLEFSKFAKIYICEFCLEYTKSEAIYKRHMAKCLYRHPPGDEIYRKDNLSVFEVNGQTATTYCQNLCLMAKLFLDHKTLWLDVAPFLFYVMTLADDRGCHMVGYFSKEKVSFLDYNVSCILVLPNFMRQGYGKMLIDFSYLLSQAEGKTGSPERPLSDLGLISYRNFWASKLLKYLFTYQEDQISIKGICEKMSIHANDVISTLQYLGMLKYWKGKHLILLKKEVIEEYSSKEKSTSYETKEIDPKCLVWAPTVYK